MPKPNRWQTSQSIVPKRLQYGVWTCKCKIPIWPRRSYKNHLTHQFKCTILIITCECLPVYIQSSTGKAACNTIDVFFLNGCSFILEYIDTVLCWPSDANGKKSKDTYWSLVVYFQQVMKMLLNDEIKYKIIRTWLGLADKS